ncbi:MAG: aminoglycoside 6-adenylyltransferase [Candidatus Latescibacterota bacterium]
MRSEEEMLRLIVDTARADDRVRAVILNGSRANPAAPRDPFQDFDIVYLVTDVAPFRDDPAWIDRFGERMILQMPGAMDDPPPANDGGFAYLMQFADGNRIDLGLFPVARAHQREQDSLSILLLDKDGVVGPFPPSSEADYLPRPPAAKTFADCCNEFWWVCPYVAKGLWREEIVYAKAMLDQYVRPQLMKMLTWHIGVRTRFASNPGKLGKHFRRYLEPEAWTLLLDTYADANYEATWSALLATCELFRKTATGVAAHFAFEYPTADDARVSAHLRHVRSLPRDAAQIY